MGSEDDPNTVFFSPFWVEKIELQMKLNTTTNGRNRTQKKKKEEEEEERTWERSEQHEMRRCFCVVFFSFLYVFRGFVHISVTSLRLHTPTSITMVPFLDERRILAQFLLGDLAHNCGSGFL